MTERRLGRVAGLVSLATLLSRVLGLVREQVFAAMLGASNLADAYIAAFRLPNLWRDLLAEGALSAALVPAYRAELVARGEHAAHRLTARIVGNLVVVVGAAVALAMVFAPALAGQLVGDFTVVPGKLQLTSTLLRVMLPFILIASLTAIAMGIQQARDQFTAPALSPATFNVVAIIIGVGLSASDLSVRGIVVGWALGTVVAGLAQLALQLPAIWRIGWRPRIGLDLRLRDPAVRRVVVTMAPAILAGAAVQLNVFINTTFASQDPGAVSWLAYGFRFLQLPIGVFGVAIATVSTTRYADAAARGDRPALGRHVADGLRLILFLCVPAMIGLIVEGDAIIRLIYQHGRFAPRDTEATATALALYAIGLPAYAAVKILAPACYAVDRTRLAAIAAVIAVAGNLAANWALHLGHGFHTLALSTAIAAIVNAGFLYVGIDRAITPLPHRELARHLTQVSIAAAIMGAATWAAGRGCDQVVGHHHLGARAITALVPIALGAAVYAGATLALGMPEARSIAARLRRRGR